MRNFCLVLSSLVFLFSLSFAQEVPQGFAAALKNYQESKFAEARTQFQELLAAYPDNANVLYNLGLAEYRLGETGPAIASWRKALSVDPGHSEAQAALDFSLGKLQAKGQARQSSFFDKLRTEWLVGIRWGALFALSLGAFFVSAWLLLGWLGRRRRAALAFEVPQPAPARQYLSFLLFLGATSLLTIKTWDLSQARGTILPKVAGAMSAPDPASTPLFEVNEGAEVIIHQESQGWSKISLSTGRSGWIPNTAVLKTSGGFF